MPTYVITGASRGLGAEIARALAADGAHLVLAARDAEKLEALAKELRTKTDITVVPTDVTVEEDRQRLVEVAGEVDLLVNNAGIEIPVSVVDHRPEDVERQVAVNLLAPIHLAKAVLPGMIERGRGTVVMVSSMSGKSPTPYNAVYTATKHGLNGFTASLRIELAGTGVHAGVVCPSFVAEAGMWADTGVKAPALMREVAPAKVVRGVREVMAGAGEVLVTPAPVRPMLAVAQLLPGLDRPLLKALGVLEALRERAAVTAARRG